jgi:hypothetical protein
MTTKQSILLPSRIIGEVCIGQGTISVMTFPSTCMRRAFYKFRLLMPGCEPREFHGEDLCGLPDGPFDVEHGLKSLLVFIVRACAGDKESQGPIPDAAISWFRQEDNLRDIHAVVMEMEARRMVRWN